MCVCEVCFCVCVYVCDVLVFDTAHNNTNLCSSKKRKIITNGKDLVRINDTLTNNKHLGESTTAIQII
jgi:hypothetical protein